MKNLGITVAAAAGSTDALIKKATNAVNSFKQMNTTEKAAAVTETSLNLGLAFAGGKIPTPGPSLVGFSESESAMIGRSLTNLSGAGLATAVNP